MKSPIARRERERERRDLKLSKKNKTRRNILYEKQLINKKRNILLTNSATKNY